MGEQPSRGWHSIGSPLLENHLNRYCPLCHNPSPQDFFSRTDPTFGQRDYFKCPECALIFLNPILRFDKNKEKAIYDNHNNGPQHEGYVAHLKKLTEPLNKKLKQPSKGLDFGCGPGPAMQAILNNHDLQLYDPIYQNNQEALKQQYDFITCTEVAEHFFNPQQEFKLLYSLLNNKSSFLGILTQTIEKENEFKDWWYHRDPTHVSFYQKTTFEWIAIWLKMKLEFFGKDVLIFEKNI